MPVACEALASSDSLETPTEEAGNLCCPLVKSPGAIDGWKTPCPLPRSATSLLHVACLKWRDIGLGSSG